MRLKISTISALFINAHYCKDTLITQWHEIYDKRRLTAHNSLGGYVMKRYYFIGDNLDELEAFENELETRGLNQLQIHVLSHHDADVSQRHLHEVFDFLRKDVIHSGLFGALLGLIAFALVIAVVHLTGLAQTAAGWVPYLFLALVLFGFCMWEGGLRGIQEPNRHFLRFQEALRNGKHVLFVDFDSGEENLVRQVTAFHPQLQLAGMEKSGPRWMVTWRQKYIDLVRALP